MLVKIQVTCTTRLQHSGPDLCPNCQDPCQKVLLASAAQRAEVKKHAHPVVLFCGENARTPCAGCEVDMQAATDILAQLKAISAAAEQGFGGTLRAASLLFTREMRVGGRWAVHLIDLAHYTESAEKRDDNFCDGLQNFVRTWEDWCGVNPPPSWFTVCCVTRK